MRDDMAVAAMIGIDPDSRAALDDLLARRDDSRMLVRGADFWSLTRQGQIDAPGSCEHNRDHPESRRVCLDTAADDS